MAFCTTTWTQDCSDRPGLKMLAAGAARRRGFAPKHHRPVHPNYAHLAGLPGRKAKAKTQPQVVHTVTTPKLPKGFRPPRPTTPMPGG